MNERYIYVGEDRSQVKCKDCSTRTTVHMIPAGEMDDHDLWHMNLPVKRVLVAMTVSERDDTHDIAIALEGYFEGSDPTVWNWQDFFKDMEDGVVSPNHDNTEVVT